MLCSSYYRCSLWLIYPVLVLDRSEKNYRSVKDLLTSSASSSPVRERASLGISAVKSMLRGKEEKITSEFRDDEAWALIQSILDAGQFIAAHMVKHLQYRITIFF